ncbi:hypothetical protein Tco_0722299 [Tanacetum coccineum]
MNKQNLFLLKDIDQDSAHMVVASKVSLLKPGEYEIWRIRIEQYIQMIDYVLWEVIKNGPTLPKIKIMEGVMIEMPITSAKKSSQKIRVPPPYTGNFMPPTPNLSFTGLDEFVNEPVVENCKAMSSDEEPKVVRKYEE